VSSEPVVEALRNERTELSNWNRHVVQLYYTWFTVFVTANVIAQGWLFGPSSSDKVPQTPLSKISFPMRMVFGSFAISNVLGVIASVRLNRYAVESNKRLDKINSLLLSGIEHHSRPESPIPTDVLRTGYVVCMIAMAVFATTWFIMVVK
jgi:hypothetical protein